MKRNERRGALAALLLLGGGAALAAMLLLPSARQANANAVESCRVSADWSAAARPLPHVAARLRAGGAFIIVAFGSSSTAGYGASSAAHSYPSRLAVWFAKRHPRLRLKVLNRGQGGEDAPEMMNRIDRDVLAARPDLVIWQVGSNAVLHRENAARMGELVTAGIRRIKRTGADVILINPQYAPAILRHPHFRAVLRVLDAVAYAEDVPMVDRFAAMRRWVDDGEMRFRVMLARDGLHMTDTSYDCLAREVADTIDVAALAAPPPAPHTARVGDRWAKG